VFRVFLPGRAKEPSNPSINNRCHISVGYKVSCFHCSKKMQIMKLSKKVYESRLGRMSSVSLQLLPIRIFSVNANKWTPNKWLRVAIYSVLLLKRTCKSHPFFHTESLRTSGGIYIYLLQRFGSIFLFAKSASEHFSFLREGNLYK